MIESGIEEKETKSGRPKTSQPKHEFEWKECKCGEKFIYNPQWQEIWTRCGKCNDATKIK